MKRVTGLGGIFFKCNDPEKVREWYKKHLGIESNQWGGQITFEQREGDTEAPSTVWTPFKADTKYFEPSAKDYMMNYRVADLVALAAVLKEEGVTILDEVSDSEYGKFLHILDIEGNKIELWEPPVGG
ncbi:MAG: VOC family protein [Bacteroidetes bacterium]|nr:VOC family protein [Bacteroidota bacterium]